MRRLTVGDLGQEVEVLLPGRHRMDDQLFTANEDEDNRLEQARTGIEPQPELSVGRFVVGKRLNP
ncbi:hypothetical protein [Tessaracoccus flavus]|uniref:hypothetical protein n=1 Tax=Tessaracoccus flavus TaxID=1610493 RepID=UPI0015A33F4F|nr:hypothetical protein [Tessaracoccus flavus]